MKRINLTSTQTVICLILISFLTSFSVKAVGTIEGVILKPLKQPVFLAKLEFTHTKSKAIYSTKSDMLGKYKVEGLEPGVYSLKVNASGFEPYVKKGIRLGDNQKLYLEISLVVQQNISELEEIEFNAISSGSEVIYKDKMATYEYRSDTESKSLGANGYYLNTVEPVYHNTESYSPIHENGYKSTAVSPLSTFSIDVDAAAYSNVRRFLLSGQKPDPGAVRLEEMINYFHYDYPEPLKDEPFSISTEVGQCPWSSNKLVHIGLQGARIEKENLPASNLVFLLDVSGSMDSPNKLPLLKKSFKMLVNELSDKDRIAIVVYAGAAGVVLESTSAKNSTSIITALESLEAGGSTAGGAGIELAYKIAQEHFIPDGNNRVILATDGDFNIGMSSDAAMEKLIEEKRKTGIFLTCLGFGTGNYQDSKMEILADKGNGNYAYIDNLLEAKKVLVTEIGATLATIAKDVKIQVEFNPAIVSSYRLIGYENRLLNDEDFNDDTKDAGEIGAGHSVTALYEVVLKGEENEKEPTVDPLKYSQNSNNEKFEDEMLTVKFRYKEPDGDKSQLISKSLKTQSTSWNSTSDNFKFSAVVAGFGMLLRNSDYTGDLLFDKIIAVAKQTKGADENGYRAEFIHLVEAAKLIYA